MKLLPFAFCRPGSGRFDLGAVVVGDGAEEALRQARIPLRDLLARHIQGNWGDAVSFDTVAENERNVIEGGALISAYRLPGTAHLTYRGDADETLYVVTEADRSCTQVVTGGDL